MFWFELFMMVYNARCTRVVVITVVNGCISIQHFTKCLSNHYDDVIMSEIASQITSLTIVYSIAHSGADQSKHQSSASLAFVWEIHRGPVNFPHKWPVTRKMFPFDDVIMTLLCICMTWRRKEPLNRPTFPDIIPIQRCEGWLYHIGHAFKNKLLI